MPTKDLHAYLEGDSNLRVEKLSSPSTTGTLNHCISTSQADVVLILDDDATPCCGWVESHVTAFARSPDLAYTSGREVRSSEKQSAFSELMRIIIEGVFGLFVGHDKKLNGRIVGWINGIGLIFGNFDQPGTCKINSPRGCNMAVRRSAFLIMGGFNNSFRGNAWGFEADFGLRMHRQKRYGRYIGDAIVIHHEVPFGGSRGASKSKWLADFLYNNKLLVKNLGPQAWFGSIPRLVKSVLTLKNSISVKGKKLDQMKRINTDEFIE
jgi:GT2 family glycosyltransferase